ncbi:MAG: YkvA family protein [Elainellaceae cyanobacterium]
MQPFGWYRHLIRNPRYRWWMIIGSLIYLLSPLDISPDLLPIVGQIDDVVVMTLLFSEVFRLVLNRGQIAESDRPDEQNPNRTSYQTAEDEVTTVDVKAVSMD